MKSGFGVIGAICAFGLAGTPLLAEVFEKEDHCVAWKAEKVMFLFNKSEPVGKNCAINVEFQATDGDTAEYSYQLTMNVPLDKFDSGDADRDKDVQEILRGNLRSEILVETDLMDRDSWRRFWAGEGSAVPVTVWVGEQSYRLNLKPEVDGERIKGQVKTQFSQFDISRPKVMMGVVASVSDNLELHFQVQKSQIQHADWLKSAEQKN